MLRLSVAERVIMLDLDQGLLQELADEIHTLCAEMGEPWHQ
jgi:hypothetical protein